MLFVNHYEQVPYKVLNLLGTKINDGGRVTDDKHELLISMILQTFICPESVEKKDGYKFSSRGLHYAPATETMEEYIAYITGSTFAHMSECEETCFFELSTPEL